MIISSQKVRVSSSKAGTKKSPHHAHGPHKGATEIDVSLWYSEIGLYNNFVVELRKSFRREWLIIGALGAGKIQCLIRGNKVNETHLSGEALPPGGPWKGNDLILKPYLSSRAAF